VTPASARSLRRAKVAELRAAEPNLSLRRMAARLGLSRDTVTRDLAELDRQAAQAAPQANEGGAATPARDAPPVALPRRVADPLADMDVSQWRALRRDLAVLAQSGLSAEAHQAVVSLAHQYKQDLAAGRLLPGQRFLIRSLDLRRAPVAAALPAQGD
jgi:DeoR/GlpR family transcriptional regulator of sugar metabolism